LLRPVYGNLIDKEKHDIKRLNIQNLKMINLKDKLKHLPDDKIAGLEFITDKIIQTGLAEMIVLYGSHARGDYKDGKIKEVGGIPTIFRSDYDILVIVDKPDEKEQPDRRLSYFQPVFVGETAIKIKDVLRPYLNEIPVQVIVEQISRVNQLIEDRQFFFLDIQREGIELYNSGKCSFVEPPEKVSPKVRRQYAEDYFEMWYEQAKGAFENENRRSNWTAFMLEQVFELCYKCIGYVFTHYAPDEHDLFKLRETAEKYEPSLIKIFPIDKPREQDDFEKLSRAYIGARYIKGYEVNKQEIERWKAEAEELLSVTEQSCKAKIEILRQLENG
jgi:predicted nucleotidyltransferase/HEPN domain-containing protein